MGLENAALSGPCVVAALLRCHNAPILLAEHFSPPAAFNNLGSEIRCQQERKGIDELLRPLGNGRALVDVSKFYHIGIGQ